VQTTHDIKPIDPASDVPGQLVASSLDVSFGGYSSSGIKSRNDDAFAAYLPTSKYIRQMKGAVACIADGISVSEKSHLASQLSVTQFIEDYLATPEGWSVEESASKVLRALNDWFSAQSRNSQASAMVTTFSAAVVKSNSLHVFHTGDSRIYRFRGGRLKQLTRDHCLNFTKDNAVLTSALGMDTRLSVDYNRTDVEEGDILLLTTDGVSAFIPEAQLRDQLSLASKKDIAPDVFAKLLCDLAVENGSDDNVTCGIAKVVSLPQENLDEAIRRVQTQTIPPVLKPGNKIRDLHSESAVREFQR